jgi:hypothetical protein
MDDARDTRLDAAHHVLLCSGCAHEAAAHRGVEAEELFINHGDAGCDQCGAVLVGFAYRVPAGVETGMAPGAG